MTKIRLSSHKLLIERGRWLNILHKDRLCTLCNKLEDVTRMQKHPGLLFSRLAAEAA